MANEKSKRLLDRIAESATEEQKQALVQWADKLLTIKESSSTSIRKAADAVSATAAFSTIKPIIVLIGKELTPRELSALSEELVSTYRSDLGLGAKLRRGALVTGKAIKDLGWDNRGLPGRLGTATALVTVVIFGGQGAGIAALGTAIGVPLWVVFGAGAAFLGELYERLTGKRRSETTYTVIEAKRKRPEDC